MSWQSSVPDHFDWAPNDLSSHRYWRCRTLSYRPPCPAPNEPVPDHILQLNEPKSLPQMCSLCKTVTDFPNDATVFLIDVVALVLRRYRWQHNIVDSNSSVHRADDEKMRMLAAEIQTHHWRLCRTYPFRIRWIFQSEQAHRSVGHWTVERHWKFMKHRWIYLESFESNADQLVT